MKNKFTIFAFVLLTIILSFGFCNSVSERSLLNNIVVEFITTNGYGNNLFIDNFSIGNQFDYDLMLYNFNLSDRNYFLPGQTSAKLLPTATIVNVGRNQASGATITLKAEGTSYNVTQNISALNSGGSTTVNFDSLEFTLNIIKNLRLYINWTSDQNKQNDSLFQATSFLPGVKRNVLFEAYTSTTCSPCASQNPALDAFVQQRFDTIVAIKYHVWWPSQGDPMHLANVNQTTVRTYLYSITSVPCLQVDGVIQQISGYTTTSNLLNPYNKRLAVGSPLSLSVTDTRLPGDTIKANVTLNIVSPLPVRSNYKLKASAIERKVTYSTPPGSNGETIFYDVFRRAYPTTSGIEIPNTPGVYNFEFKYKRESNWVDSMIYTAVFVQNEINAEVINCAKARNWYDKIELPKISSKSFDKNNFCLNPEATKMQTDAGCYIEGFEYGFPPEGWKMINPDDGLTFMKYSGPNGPSAPGGSAVRMRFFNYTDTGQVDYLLTRKYDDIDLSDSIRFDWAYAPRTGFIDRMQVKVSTNGGNTFPITIFDKAGSLLATAPAQSTAFTPTASQWGRFAVKVGDILVGTGLTGSNIPDKYELKQNYPNPFNPVTRIDFSIPKRSFVILKIFDISGKEVEALINEISEAGNYSVIFKAENLPSGIYFCKLNAGNFTDVKKMVLIK